MYATKENHLKQHKQSVVNCGENGKWVCSVRMLKDLQTLVNPWKKKKGLLHKNFFFFFKKNFI